MSKDDSYAWRDTTRSARKAAHACKWGVRPEGVWCAGMYQVLAGMADEAEEEDDRAYSGVANAGKKERHRTRVGHIDAVVDATAAIVRAHLQAAEPGVSWLRRREEHRPWLGLVFDAWQRYRAADYVRRARARDESREEQTRSGTTRTTTEQCMRPSQMDMCKRRPAVQCHCDECTGKEAPPAWPFLADWKDWSRKRVRGTLLNWWWPTRGTQAMTRHNRRRGRSGGTGRGRRRHERADGVGCM